MRREVLREGEPTLDGRYVEHYAVELPEDPIPLVDYDIISDDEVVVGFAENFTRDDDGKIYCDVTVDDPRVVTVALLIIERTVVGGEDLGIKNAKIINCLISDKFIYPWSDDE